LAFGIGSFGIQSFVPNSAFRRSALGRSAFSRSVFNSDIAPKNRLEFGLMLPLRNSGEMAQGDCPNPRVSFVFVFVFHVDLLFSKK
jgi:hypothetical protein